MELAFREATKAFNQAQYQHLVLQFQELAREDIPTHSKTADIDAIEDFHELRDKGGVLGSVNARVFFGIDKQSRAIVILGAIQKTEQWPNTKR